MRIKISLRRDFKPGYSQQNNDLSLQRFWKAVLIFFFSFFDKYATLKGYQKPDRLKLIKVMR